MERPDICPDCIHYHVCEDAYNCKSECMNYLSENDVIIVRHETGELNNATMRSKDDKRSTVMNETSNNLL